MKRLIVMVVATAMFCSVAAKANDEVADLQARIASLEAKMMAPAASGDAESLMSLQKKGQIKIGGDTKLTLRTIHQDERNLGSVPGLADNVNLGASANINGNQDMVQGGDTMDYTTWDWEASLKFKVEANADTYLFWKLDLEDADDEDDLVEEVGIVFENVRGSNWTIILGKDEMPFGADCCRLITDPFVHGGSSILATQGFRPATTDNAVTNATNPHATIGLETGWAGEIDNVVGVQAHYKYKDLAKLELAIFQNNDAQIGDGSAAIGMHEDRSEDQFQSYAARLWVYPVENLKTQISYSNRHWNSMGDSDSSGVANARQFREANEHALSVSFAYDWKPMKLDFYGEYIHNWNMDYKSDLSADIFQLGVGYALTPKISLQGWWEMVDIDNGYARHGEGTSSDGLAYATYTDTVTNGGQNGIDKEIDETFQRIGLGTTYTMDCGIKFTGEWLYEWYNNDLNWYEDADAHSLAFRTEYAF